MLDEIAAKLIERIAEQRRHRPSLLDRALLAISPHAAFDPANLDYTDEQVSKILIHTAHDIGDAVSCMLKKAAKLDELFKDIRDILTDIKKNSMSEINHLPQMNVLNELWTRLAHVKMYGNFKSHQSLLADLAQYYHNSSYMIRETRTNLIFVEMELKEFKDSIIKRHRTQPILKEQPLENIIPLFRKAGLLLGFKKGELQRIRKGARPPPIEIPIPVIREATVIKPQTRSGFMRLLKIFRT